MRITMAFIAMFFSLPAQAGFSLTHYIGDTGHARAGGSAIGIDATAVTVNPAAMTRSQHDQWLISTHYYSPSISFTNNGSTDSTGQPLTGGNGGNGGTSASSAGFYYSRPLGDKWWLGFAVNTPFALRSQYDSHWVGRYQSVEASIDTVATTLSLAKQFSNDWSVGGGVYVQRVNMSLSNAIDFGSACLSFASVDTCTSLGMPSPQSADGLIDIDGEDVSVGGLLGVLYNVGRYRLGASYRSRVSYDLRSNVNFTTPLGVAAFSPMFTDTTASSSLTLPEQLSFSGYSKINSAVGIMFDIAWTNWHRVNELNIDYANPAQPNTVIPKQWNATTRLAAGLDYLVTPQLTLHAGIANESSPIPAKTYDPGVPIAGVTWYAVGARYDIDNSYSIDCAINYVRVDAQTIHISGATGETLNGRISSSMAVYGLTIRGSF